MIFLDSNAVIDLMNRSVGGEREWAISTYEKLAASETFCSNLIVFSEVAVGVQRPEDVVADFARLELVLLDLTPSAALRAAAAFREYRRRGGPRSTMLPDFLIAAHAATLGATLMTRDRRLASYFPELTFLTPENENG